MAALAPNLAGAAEPPQKGQKTVLTAAANKRNQNMIDLARSATNEDDAALVRLRELLRQGAHPNATDRDGWTALEHAANNNYVRAARILLDAGAKVDQRDTYGRTALIHAASNGQTEAVRLLLERGANPNVMGTKYKDTPLLCAAHSGHTATALLLLQKGAKPGTKDEQGHTALFRATVAGSPELIKELKRRGVKEDLCEEKLLLAAASYGNRALTKQLLDSGTDMEAKDEYGWSVLMLAANAGHAEIVELLIGQGVNVNRRTTGGGTALQQAKANKHESVIKLLVAAGAK